MQLLQLELRSIREVLFATDGQSILVEGMTTLPQTRVALGRLARSGRTALAISPIQLTGDCMVSLHASGRFAFCLESLDGTELVAVYDSIDGRPLPICQSPVSVATIHGMTFGPSDNRIAVICHFSLDYDANDHGVFVWDINRDDEPTEWRTPGLPSDVVLSPDDRTVVVGSDVRGCVWTYDLPTGRAQSIDNVDPRRLAISPTGKLVAAAGGRVVIWNLEGMHRECHFRGQDEDVPSLAFSPDERLLAVARTDGPVEFRDVATGELVRRYDWNIGRLGAIAFAPDGLTCAVAGDRGRIVVWDVDE